MDKYCVNMKAQATGEHEVHNLSTCKNLPHIEHRKPLGEFSSCNGAVAKAKQTYPTADGCKYCCAACHNG